MSKSEKHVQSIELTAHFHILKGLLYKNDTWLNHHDFCVEISLKWIFDDERHIKSLLSKGVLKEVWRSIWKSKEFCTCSREKCLFAGDASHSQIMRLAVYIDERIYSWFSFECFEVVWKSWSFFYTFSTTNWNHLLCCVCFFSNFQENKRRDYLIKFLIFWNLNFELLKQELTQNQLKVSEKNRQLFTLFMFFVW